MGTTSKSLSFEEAHKKVCEQVSFFEANIDFYKSKKYKEAEVRQDFIDDFFTYLGWDVTHKFQKSPWKQEVKIEKVQKQNTGGKKFADYAFYLDPDFKNPVFFVEAKKPSALLEDNKEYYIQTHKYGWNSNVPLSVLTDFEEFIIIDCRSKPNIESSLETAIKKYNFKDYIDPEKFKEIFYLFSREAVIENSIENFVDSQIKQLKSGRRSIANQSVNNDFLVYIDKLRLDLANSFLQKNQKMTSHELTVATQKTIDRLVFTRFLEDKQIEYDDHINGIKKWKDFIKISKNLDTKYNGVVYKPSIIDSPSFKGADDSFFRSLCGEISSLESPYNFNAIPIHIIGSIYERFLGKVVNVNNSEALIEQKPEVRKAGGVFYTPKYIVDYLVNKTVKSQIQGKTPKQIDEMSFADISCGSGSFLIGVYECLIEYHKGYYHSKFKGKTKITKGNDDFGDVEYRDGNWVITLKRKQAILLNCVYGVDIDSQAVQVTQLSLFLKLLEDESLGTTYGFQTTLYSKVLPDLSSNIKCGNSLVGWDVSSNMGGLSIEEELKVNPFDFRMKFPKIFPKGFDVLVGNPPYVKEGKIDKRVMQYIKNSYCSPYYQGKMDLWYFFVCNGLDLLNENGRLGYIAPNNWVTNSGASKLRNKIIRDSKILEIVDFGDYMVFEDASIQTMNFILQKNNFEDNYKLQYSKLLNHSGSKLNAISCLNRDKNKNNLILTPTVKRENFLDNYLLFGDSHVIKLLNKIKSKANFSFNKKDELSQGIVAPQDAVNKKSSEVLNLPVSTGIFVLSNDELESLKLSKKELSLIKPLYTSKQVKRYFTDEENEFNIIYTTSHYKNIDSLSEYPKIKTHIDKFQKVLTSTYRPYGLHRSRNEYFFKDSKILVLRKCSGFPIFSYVPFDSYVTQSFNVIKSSRIDLKYLTALLNSKLIRFWLLNKGKMQGKNFQLDTGPLLEIPIVKSNNSSITSSIVKLVDNILLNLKTLSSVKTQREVDFLEDKISFIESQINIEVYKLYDITAEEVAIIEDC